MEQVAAICYRLINNSTEYLLVRTHSGRWTFPKGSVEPGEEGWSAAQREAFEEAGVAGNTAYQPFTTYLHAKKEWEEDGREVAVYAFLMEVKETQMPEETHRNPTWFLVPEAEAALVKGRPERYGEELRRVLYEAHDRISRAFEKSLD